MGTSGSFVNASPPCYGAMTYVQALALRAAAGLRVGCPVIITDGPTIGTAGNTSVTRIELQPVSTTEWGVEAKIDTTFASSGGEAWFGLYNVDRGTKGAIYELRDLWGNVVRDADTDAPTVHTQFPWHLSSTTVRDNVIEDCVLTGLVTPLTAGASFSENVLKNSTVVMTGVTNATSRFDRNVLLSTTVTMNPSTVFVNDNQLNQAVVTHAGSGAASFSFQNNVMLTGSVNVDAGTTSQVTINNNVFGGTAGGFRVQVTGKTTGLAIFSGNRVFNQGPGSQDVLFQGTGNVDVTGNSFNTVNISLNGAGASTISDSQMNKATVTKGATVSGPVIISGCIAAGTTVTFTGTGAGGSTMSQCATEGGTITMNTTSSGLLTLNLVTSVGSTLTASASGAVAPVNQNGRLLGTTLDTAGFAIDVFDIVGGTKTLTANQSDRLRNASFTNLI